MPTQDELNAAYKDGLDAGWRQGRYEGNMAFTIECPYPPGPLHDRWYDGFGDGTEDFIACKYI